MARVSTVLAACLLVAALPRHVSVAAQADGGVTAAGGLPSAAAAASAANAAAASAAPAPSPVGPADFPTLWQYYEALLPSDGLRPTATTMRGHEVLFQIPAAPRATLFIAPGCAHHAHDWWPPGEACPHCLGLPEEVAHTQQALARGYAVLAMSAHNPRGDQCMDWSSNHRDAAGVITDFLKKHGLAGLPLYGLGVSVGGGFVLKLPQHIKFDGIMSEVLGPRPYAWDPWTYQHGMPPVVFVSMDGDPYMAWKISQDSQILRNMSVPVATVRVTPRTLHPSFFSDRSARIPPDISAHAVAGLRRIGMLDERNMLNQDPRHTKKPWVKELVAEVPELAGSLEADHSHVWEEANLAFASHEIISDFATAAFMWFESGGRADFAELVAAHAPAGSGVVRDALEGLPISADEIEAARAKEIVKRGGGLPAHAAGKTPAKQHGKDAAQAAEQQQQQQQQQEPPLPPPQQQPAEQRQQQGGAQLQQLGGRPGDVLRELSAQQAADAQLQQQQVQQQQLLQQQPAGSQAGTQPAGGQPDGAAPLSAQGGPQQVQQLPTGAAKAEAAAPAQALLQPQALPSAVAAPAPTPADLDVDAAQPSEGAAHSAAAIVGGVAGTLLGAGVLLVLYRLSERKRAGFMALPTHVSCEQHAALPVSRPALAPIPETTEEDP